MLRLIRKPVFILIIILASSLVYTQVKVSSETERKIIIVAGQSNALNWHSDAALLPADTTDKNIPFFYHTGLPPSKGGANCYNGTSGNKWVTLKYQTQNPYTALKENFFGPEMSLARQLYKAGNNISVIKCTYAGTNLAKDWIRGATTGNQLYSVMMKQIDSALQQLTKAGYKTKIIGFFWMQGESDAEDSVFSKNYKANLARFISNLRSDLGNGKMPFILGRIGGKSSYPYKEIVRKAQVDITVADTLVKWVNTDDFQFDTDNIHYLAPSVITLGTRMAAAWLSVSVTSVNENVNPSKYVLEQNYPNPFNPKTNIKFFLPFAGNVKLLIYDMSGRIVAELANGRLNAGEYNIPFKAENLASGVYFYRINIFSLPNNENFTSTRKMIILK
jgi:Domain of unknown function (DUF303).